MLLNAIDKDVYKFQLGAKEYKNTMSILKRKAPFLKPEEFNSEGEAREKHGEDVNYIGKGIYDSWGEADIIQNIKTIFFMEIMDCILLDWETYSRPYRKVIAAIYNAKQFDKLACKDVNEAIQQLFKQEEDDDKQYTSKS